MTGMFTICSHLPGIQIKLSVLKLENISQSKKNPKVATYLTIFREAAQQNSAMSLQWNSKDNNSLTNKLNKVKMHLK